MTQALLLVASFLSLFFLLFASIQRKQASMSASVDSLTTAVLQLTGQVQAVTAAVAALKSGQVDPADVAAVDKAVADVQAATAALTAAVG